MSMMDFSLPESSQVTRMLVVVGIVLASHLLVYAVRRVGHKIQSAQVRASSYGNSLCSTCWALQSGPPAWGA